MLTNLIHNATQMARNGSIYLNSFYSKDGGFALTKVALPTNQILNVLGVHYFDQVPLTTEPVRKALYAIKFTSTIAKDWMEVAKDKKNPSVINCKLKIPRYSDGGIHWAKVCGLSSELMRTGGWLKANNLIPFFPVPAATELKWNSNKTINQIPGVRSLLSRPEEFFGLVSSSIQIKRYYKGQDACNSKLAFSLLTACVGRVFLIVFTQSWVKGKQWQQTTLLVVNFTVQFTSILNIILKTDTGSNAEGNSKPKDAVESMRRRLLVERYNKQRERIV